MKNTIIICITVIICTVILGLFIKIYNVESEIGRYVPIYYNDSLLEAHILDTKLGVVYHYSQIKGVTRKVDIMNQTIVEY